MRTIQFVILGLFLLLQGCVGPLVPVVDTNALPNEERKEINAIKIYSSQDLEKMKYETLGSVKGHSCKNKLWDPPATRESALEQVKYYALKLGADGITDIKYGDKEGTSLKTNCWELISCTANAIKIK